MVQGKLKTKTKLPENCKQKSVHRVQKAKEKSKSHKQKKNSIGKIVKNNLEVGIKKSIEKDLASQAKSIEGKSLRLLK